jgi:CubicO group peptidase (beta-lactamase class C family)
MAVFHSAWVVGDAAEASDKGADSIVPWWSFTKTVLAVAALRLAEAGKLELDTPLVGKPYSLRQLLLHRAGVPNYGRLQEYHDAVARGEDAWPRERLLNAVNADRLDFGPGTRWSYSNVGYLFVRDAIEQASGLPLAEALRQLVLAPLNLQGARLATKRADFAQVVWPKLKDYDPGWVYHGCLVGTPLEAARLLHAVFNGSLLLPTSVGVMFERSTILEGVPPDRPWTQRSYALGLMTGTMVDAGRAWGHTGAGPHSANAVYHFPDLDRPVTAATFSNAESEGPVEFEAAAIAVEMQESRNR